MLHIVANYPDEVFTQPTTNAVKNLLVETADVLEHFVVSIARVSFGQRPTCITWKGGMSIGYHGFPALIGHSIFLRQLANRIVTELRRRDLDFDVIHAHKLTVEGVVAQQIAGSLGWPLVVTLRGLTDERILHLRPDLMTRFAEIVTMAREIFLPAPWTEVLLAKIKTRYKKNNDLRPVVLPNIVQLREAPIVAYEPGANGRFLTVFRNGQGKRKGFMQLLVALHEAKLQGQIIKLDVIGSTADGVEARNVRKRGLESQVRFLGVMSNAETLDRMRKYEGLLLPTVKDTFGMVFVEALFAGTPILYSSGTGIDGYLTDMEVGVRVDPRDQASVTAGVMKLSHESFRFRANLHAVLADRGLDAFKSSTIAEQYCSAIRRATSPR